MAENGVTHEQLQELAQEWLETIHNGKELWDGVYCSDREMAASFVVEGRLEEIKSFVDFVGEKMQNVQQGMKNG